MANTTNDCIRFMESTKNEDSPISNAIRESLMQEAIQMGILPPSDAQEKAAPSGAKIMAPTATDSAKDPERISYQYMNVMEHSVKELCGEYMQKLGVCSCDRCRSDVIALSLTNLPPKYRVADCAEAAPLLNFYISKYDSLIRAELTKACFTVLGNPRHQPSE